MNINNPIISVLMSVYNTKETYLKDSINSILNQTFKNFEFIIISDCPTDNSNNILEEYKEKDNRIKLIYNNHNLGLTKSLNIGLKIATGKYIARMDSDDVARIDRLEKQFNYMESHNDIDILGSYVYSGDNHNIIPKEINSNLERLKISMLFINSGIPHPTAFIRKKFLDSNNITYDEKIKKSQDYKLWVDSLKYNANIKIYEDMLLYYRIHDEQISKNKTDQHHYAFLVNKELLSNLIDNINDDILNFHCNLYYSKPSYSKNEYLRYFKYLNCQNMQKNIYDTHLFKLQLKCLWLKISFMRLKYIHKLDFIFSLETLTCLNYKTVKEFYFTYRKPIKKYYKIKRNFLKNKYFN